MRDGRMRRGWPRALLLASVASVGSSWPSGAAEVLIPRQSVWAYLDDGSDPGVAWREPEFTAAWKSGPAELGFGDGEQGAEGTVLDADAFTCYFRHAFELAPDQAAAIAGLRLGVRRDDGVIVYLNGREVYRLGLEPGPIGPFDDGRVTASKTHFYRWFLGPELLRAGKNVVAVEMHKADEDDTDLSFDLELVAVGADEAEIWRGPYLQRGTPTGVTIRFTTSVPVAPTLRWGTAPDAPVGERVGTRGVEHEFVLEGLPPDTLHYYAVDAEGRRLAGGDAEHAFRTHPLPGVDRPTRIWVLGDSGDGQFSRVQRVIEDYRAFGGGEPPDVWLLLGDNAYKSGTLEEHQDAVFDAFTELLPRTVAWPIIGNHDKRSITGEGGPYFDLFTLPTAGEAGGVPSGTEYYYAFDYGAIHFVALFSSLDGLAAGSPQLAWLEQDLAASAAEWKIALLHVAPYSTGEHDSDHIERHIDIRRNALPILERHGVDLVLAGHSHCYQRSWLIRGHYGPSTSWDPERHRVQAGDGCPNDDRASECSGGADGPYTGDGTVYVIVGNSSLPDETGLLSHPVVAHGEVGVAGSLVIDVAGPRLEARFLREGGEVADRFVLLHGVEPATPVEPSRPARSLGAAVLVLVAAAIVFRALRRRA